MLGAKRSLAARSLMPCSTSSASARLSPRVYSGNGCVEMRMPGTSYPAALTASRTWLRNFTASSICDGYDFASIVTKPVIARTFGFERRPRAPPVRRTRSGGRSQTGCVSNASSYEFTRVPRLTRPNWYNSANGRFRLGLRLLLRQCQPPPFGRGTPRSFASLTGSPPYPSWPCSSPEWKFSSLTRASIGVKPATC